LRVSFKILADEYERRAEAQDVDAAKAFARSVANAEGDHDIESEGLQHAQR
jgi:hypothetical protein